MGSSGSRGEIDTLGKGVPTSNHSLHPAQGGGDRAGRSMAVPPRAAYEASSAHLCLPAQAPGRSSAVTGEPGQACCSVLSNRSLGGGERPGGCCGSGAAHFTGPFPRAAGPGRSGADGSIFEVARPV